MFEKKLSKKIYFSIMFLAALLFCTIFLFIREAADLGQILGNEGSIGFEIYLILLIFSLVCVVCFSSALVLIRQVVKFNNAAFSVDREGIHDTFVGIVFFALIIILPVRQIPWSAVREIKEENGKTHIKINRKDVVASPIAKLILGVFGFDFCHNATQRLNETEKAIVTTYCYQSPDCVVNEEEITDDGIGYSKKAKAGMIILIILNALFLVLTFFDYSSTAEISCIFSSLFASVFGLEGKSAFSEALHIAEGDSIIYLQIQENYLYYIWTLIKTVHIVLTLALAYLMVQKSKKIRAKKLILNYIICTILISLAGTIVLQFAVHNRVEANENNVIISEYGKKDTILTNYKDAEKVRVYIAETRDGKYISYECAVDVTVKGNTYTFFGTESPSYEDMERFINLFDESIVEIDTTYWDTDDFQEYTYWGNEEIIDRIFKQ